MAKKCMEGHINFYDILNCLVYRYSKFVDKECFTVYNSLNI